MAFGKPRIFEEIEVSADYIGPGIYEGLDKNGEKVTGLLTHYHDLEVSRALYSDEFIPLTTTRTRREKLFAVGVLPPTARVTGRVLDRSYSIAGEVVGGASSGGVAIETLSAQQKTILELALEYADISCVDNYDKWMDLMAGPNEKGNLYFAAPAISTCALTVRGLLRKAGLRHHRLKDKYRTNYAGEDLREIGEEYNAIRNADYPNLPQPGWVVCVGGQDGLGGNGHVFTVLEVNKVGANIATLKSMDGGQTAYDGGQSTKTFTNRIWRRGGKNDKEGKDIPDGKYWWDENGYGINRRVVYYIDTSVLPYEEVTLDEDPSDDWNSEGKQAARKAAKTTKIEGTGLNRQNHGRLLQAAQRLQIAETRAAIEAMRRAPPLRLMVNPASFSVSGTKIVQDGNWGRNGPIVEHWGEEQDSISASGKVAGFFALDRTRAQGPGLTRYARSYSAGWRNLVSLYLFYKNNGAIYLNDPMVDNGSKRNLSLVGSVYIYYDNILYIGSFTSFSIKEAAEQPFSVEYDFEFSVRAAFLLDRPDPLYNVTFNYDPSQSRGHPVAASATAGGPETPPEILQPEQPGERPAGAVGPVPPAL